MPRRGQVEIVGVVADARDMSVRDPVPPTVYMPLMAADEPWIEIGIRPAVDDQQLPAADCRHGIATCARRQRRVPHRRRRSA